MNEQLKIRLPKELLIALNDESDLKGIPKNELVNIILYEFYFDNTVQE